MDYLKEILKGVLIGVANIVPGVSGGTLAVSMGIYDKIIKAVTHIAKDTRGSVKTLFPYGVGAMLGILGLSFVIEWLFGSFPLQTSLLFIGLIMGGLPVLSKHLHLRSIGIWEVLAFSFTFFSMVILTVAGNTGLKETVLSAEPVTLITLFFIGMIGAATMVIPGVSGTMILMMLGYYQPILAAINRFVLAGVEGNISLLWQETLILAPFGFGMLAGIFACAKLIEWLLSRFEMITYCGIMGLVISSPIVILSSVSLGGIQVPTVLSGLVCLGLACMGSMGLSKKSETQTER